jgi:hypothetical protein
MSIKGGIRGKKAIVGRRLGKVEPKKVETEQKVEAKKVEGPAAEIVDDSKARAALKALALQSKSPEKKEKANGGAEAATLGAKLMGMVANRKVGTAVALGLSLFGTAQGAMAQVTPVETTQTDAGQKALAGVEIGHKVGDGFVQVNGDLESMEKVFELAEKGELDVKNLVINTEDGKLPSSYQLKDLKQKFPEAFKSVETVHVVGHNLQSNPFSNYQGEIFENVDAIVGFDVSTSLNPKAASDWVIDQNVEALAGFESDGMSAQDAMIKAKEIAQKGADKGLRTRVDVEGQTHTQAPENALSEWLDAQQKPVEGSEEKPTITKAELSEKLQELAGSEEGLTDSMLGVLNSKMGERRFKIDYDAARMASQLIDVHVAAGPEQALEALKNGNISEVRHALATEANADVAYAQERSDLFKTEITRGVPLAGDEAIPTDGLQGKAFLVDGLGDIRNGEVNVQSIHDLKEGDGYQLTFKLTDKAGAEMEGWLAEHDARLIDKTVMNYAPTEDGRVVTAEKSDEVEATGVIENQRPEMSLGPAFRAAEEGKFQVDYFAESTSKQATRGEVHIQVYGETEAERKENMRELLGELGLNDEISGQPSEETEGKLKAFRLLEQADPRAHNELMEKIGSGGEVTMSELHDALVTAEVPPAFLQQAYFAEASPGHLSVIVPGQSEAYARRGVRGVYHTISKSEIFAYIANDGALMSTKDRLAVGKVFRGMSSDTDLRTGGADYVFTRQVTEPMGNPSMSSMRGGAIVMKSDVLDRADWYAYSGDKYGTTLTGDRGDPSQAVTEMAQKSYDALKEAGDSSVNGKTFEQWFENLIKKQTDRRQDTYLPRPVGAELVEKTTGTSNETMLEGTIPIEQIEAFLVRNQEAKDKTVAKCKELGLEEINGIPVEDFIQVRDKFFTEEQMEMFEAAPSDKVGEEQDLKDPRLEFYVQNNSESPGEKALRDLFDPNIKPWDTHNA